MRPESRLPRRLWLIAGIIAGTAVVDPSLSAETGDPSDFTAAEVKTIAAEVLGRARYQVELPRAPDAETADTRGESRGEDAPQLSFPNVPEASATPDEQLHIPGWLLWLLAGAGFLLLLTVAVLRMRAARPGSARELASEVKREEAEANPARASHAPGNPDALARRGAYAEAIHALLLRSLRELVDKHDYKPAASLTSREILERAPLTAEAKHALMAIISVVELTRFGGRPSGESDYLRCLDSYRRFAGAAAVQADG